MPRASLADIVSTGTARIDDIVPAGETAVPEQDYSVSGFAGNVLKGLKQLVTRPDLESGSFGDVGAKMLTGVKQIPAQVGNQLAHPIQSAYEDPVGLALNASMVAAPGRAVLRGMSGPLTRGAETVYGKALKVPNTILKRNPNVNIARTGLDSRVRVSGAGIEKNAREIERLEHQIGTAVDASPATETMTLAGMPATQAELAASGKLTAANPDRLNVKARVDQFMDDPNIKDRPLSMRELQDNKVEIGKLAYDRAAQPSMAMSDVNQSLYSDLRGALNRHVPEVAPLNDAVSPRYALQDALTQRVPVAARRDVVPMAGAIGSVVSGGGGGKRIIAAMINTAMTNPALLSQAAITVDAAAKRLARLPKTMDTLAPYATMTTFARTLQGEPPTGQAARDRGQIVTAAIKELAEQPGFDQLTVQQRDQVFQQTVSDVSLLVGGVVDATRLKSRASRIVKEMMAAHTTERP